MKLKDIFKDSITKVFIVVNEDFRKKRKCIIEPTDLEVLPDDENFYLVKALEICETGTTDCFIGIVTPERIADFVVKRNKRGRVVVEYFYKQLSRCCS